MSIRNLPRAVLTAGVAVAAVAAGALAPHAAASASTAPSSGPAHVFVIMMENHGYDQIIGNTTDAPYINSLATRYNVETNYHGVTHPSLPEYLAALSGSTQGIWDDCAAGANVTCAPEEFVPGSGDATSSASLTPAQISSASATPHMFSGKNLVDQLEAKGLSWKAYMQSLPYSGFHGYTAPVVNGTSVALYSQKHNPFEYFSDITSSAARESKVVPFENNFSHDLATGNMPDFAWISPDQCHDMHGTSQAGADLVGIPACGYPADPNALDHGAIQLGDGFLKSTVGEIMNSNTWKTTKSSIVIMWDENDYSGYSGGPGSPVGENGVVLGGGVAPLLVINSHAGPHVSVSTSADEYTVLATIEKMWHLGCLANTCSPTTSGQITEMFHN